VRPARPSHRRARRADLRERRRYRRGVPRRRALGPAPRHPVYTSAPACRHSAGEGRHGGDP